MSETHLTDVAFAGFGLTPELMQGIEETGFSKCTPIQAETLPVALAGRDVAGQAQTGTGKTAAFLIATFQKLLASESVAEGQRHEHGPESVPGRVGAARRGPRRRTRECAPSRRGATASRTARPR